MRGLLAPILHAHLPFVRHPEHANFLEEAWLFEALAESYLPLLRCFEGWTRDRLPWQLTLTVTPTLGSLLKDRLLAARFDQYLHGRLELAERELERHTFQPELARLAGFYGAYYQEAQRTWESIGRNPVAALAHYAQSGHLEVLSSAATHAFLPLLADHPPSVRAQLETARVAHESWFGHAPRGIWLPECGFVPALDAQLRQSGFSHFVLESHGLLNADPLPRRGLLAPILTPAGCAAFGRDPSSARQVWSRHGGYPGDPRYREFHRDLIHDADPEYLRAALGADSPLAFSGFKYHRVTSHEPHAEKALYDRAAALAAVADHAQHFLAGRRNHTASVQGMLGQPPLVVAPYDCELFGHWWFEGPEFLDAVVRGACQPESGLELTHLAGYLERFPVQQQAQPATSSWGEGGYSKVWLNPKNAWMQPPLRRARARMSRIVGQRGFEPADPLVARALRQAGRELLLAQSSDWPFLITAGTAADYARRRFIDHVAAVERLLDQVDQAAIDLAGLQERERRHNLFPELSLEPWLERD